MKCFSFTSALAPYIEGLINEKRALGYKYDAEAYVFSRLDRYWKEQGHTDPELCMEAVEKWLIPSENEGASSVAGRAYAVRQLARYMIARGVATYIPINREKHTKPLIHVLSGGEIAELLRVIDGYTPTRPYVNTLRMSLEYKVLFRLILTTGLRRTEAATIETENVDLDNAAISILAAKGRKDRLIYLSDDMAEMIATYMERMQSFSDGDSLKWLFPGIDIGNYISPGALSSRFRGFWEKTSCSVAGGRRPTMHALRHTYVVMRMNSWMEHGLDFSIMLPYLSRYLGHRSPNETYYYYHQVVDSFKVIQSMDSMASEVIPEVRTR